MYKGCIKLFTVLARGSYAIKLTAVIKFVLAVCYFRLSTLFVGKAKRLSLAARGGAAGGGYRKVLRTGRLQPCLAMLD
jgi:hypothetical protein